MLKDLRSSWFFPLLFPAFLPLIGCSLSPKSVAEVLIAIPQIDSMRQIEGDSLFVESWELWFSQPVDHKNPKGPKFPQRVIYNHVNFDKPMVVVIEGYTLFSPLADEPTRILGANQINIEHRFFDQSRPKDSIPWEYLNIFQSATDQHKVIQAFKPFYRGKWLSTGISKGGQATIFHRYFYPNDVDVSIPYVAPLNFSSEDERVYTFLEEVGTTECREKIRKFQAELFKRKKKLMPFVQDFASANGYTFSMGLERAYDINVLEYNFAYWQWSGLTCDQIPDSTYSDFDLFKHWATVASFDFIEDKGVDDVRPFFYQAMTEIGMYGYQTDTWNNYLNDSTSITFEFTMPEGHKAIFDPEPMRKVNEWVQRKGNNMLYIYGENDPWSATAVEIGPKTNAVKFVNPGGDHTTRIKSFPPELRDSIYVQLEDWLELNIVNQ